MRKPDWKIAVVGGSIAALGLGGFAAAQGGGASSDSDLPDGIRLQRDASVSVQSLSSTINVQPTVADSVSATVASLTSVASISMASLDSVPAVAPAPQPAPAPADDSVSVDSVASLDSVDSASVASVDDEGLDSSD